jgi:molybdate transport system substrate-binding protein
MLKVGSDRNLHDGQYNTVQCKVPAHRAGITAAGMFAAAFVAAHRSILRLAVLIPVFASFVLPARAETGDIVVFGAIVLKEALDEANDALRTENAGRAVASYGASATLAKQIESGERADVFFSGDLASMDYLAERKLIRPDTRKNLLGNRLVFIAPSSSTVALTIGPNFPLAQALGSGQLAIANPESTPAGRYTKAALESLGVWPSVASKVAVVGGSRGVLTSVAHGQASLGILWQTDTAGEKDVKVVAALPESSHPPIVYPLAVLANSNNDMTPSYVQYLLSPRAAPVFRKRGFAVY